MNIGVVVTIGLLITVTLSLLIVAIAILSLSGRHARQEERDANGDDEWVAVTLSGRHARQEERDHIDRLETELRRTLGGRRE